MGLRLLPILLGANLDNDQAPHMGSLSAMSLFLLAVAVALQAAAATAEVAATPLIAAAAATAAAVEGVVALLPVL